MRRLLLALAVLAATAAACTPRVDPTGVPAPPVVTTAEVRRLLADSELPVVLNVWASWCIPCRSEAPLLATAAGRFDGRVRFVGLDVADGADDARRFIAEFYRDVPIEHLANPDGTIPADLGGGPGVPLTFFFRPGGDLTHLHHGVIDERTLALQIDELLAGGR